MRSIAQLHALVAAMSSEAPLTISGGRQCGKTQALKEALERAKVADVGRATIFSDPPIVVLPDHPVSDAVVKSIKAMGENTVIVDIAGAEYVCVDRACGSVGIMPRDKYVAEALNEAHEKRQRKIKRKLEERRRQAFKWGEYTFNDPFTKA